MAPRLAVVTGGYGAIGYAIARGILASPGWAVVLVGRDPQKLARAKGELVRATQSSDIHVMAADLSRKESVQALAARLLDPVSVLVNNAATAPRRREETPDGLELQFATNVMGYYWMMAALEPALAAADEPRVVNVASYWAGDLDLDDLQFTRRRYDNNCAYRQSKAADRMLTVAFAEQFRASKVAVNSCHPGDVDSKLSNSLGFGGHETAARAAETPLALALGPLGYETSGVYFEHGRPAPCRFGAATSNVRRLYEICTSYA